VSYARTTRPGFLYSTKRLTPTTVSPELAATNAVQPFDPILFPVDSVVPLLDLVSRPHGIPTLPRQLGKQCSSG
jgi:hypothetical protein